MTESARIVRVFVSSPGGLETERDAIDSAVDEINRTLGRNEGVHFETLRWGKDIISGISNEPESVIIEQIDDNYDIFVGIMGARFGTQTKKFGSGTEEEFENALNKYKSSGKIKILFYFKSEKVDIGKIGHKEIEQISKVAKFKDKLSESGVLYISFKNTDELGRNVRLALSSFAKEFNDPSELSSDTDKIKQENTWHSASQRSWATTDISEIVDEDDGVLDQMEKAITAQDHLVQSTNNIHDLIDGLNKIMEKSAAEVKQANLSNIGIRERKNIVNKFATELVLFASQFSAEAPRFRSSSAFFVDNFSSAASNAMLMNLGTTEEREKLLSEVKFLYDSINGASDGVGGLMDAIESLPRLTKELNRAKAEATEAIYELYAELNERKLTLEYAINIMEGKG